MLDIGHVAGALYNTLTGMSELHLQEQYESALHEWCACVCVCMHACVCVRVHACMCVRVHLRLLLTSGVLPLIAEFGSLSRCVCRCTVSWSTDFWCLRGGLPDDGGGGGGGDITLGMWLRLVRRCL